MLILDTTTRSLQAKLGGTVTTNQLVCVSAWIDHTSSAYTPGSTNILTNNITAVTLVAAPGASTQRSIKYFTIQNADTVSQTVTIIYNDNATLRNILVVALSVNDTLQYIDTDGFSVIDTTGQKKSIVSIGAALPSGTNVVGHVIADTGSTTAVTGNVTAVQSTATNLKVDASGVAVPVTDNSGSLTVDQATGTNLHTVVDSGTITTVSTVTNLSQLGGVAVSLNTGVRDTGTQRVTIATNDVVPASQSGTWTVQPGNTANTTAWLTAHGKTIKTVSGSLTADTDVIAAVSTKRLKVIAYSLISVGTNANTIIFKSNGIAGTELWRVLLQSSTAIAAGANLSIPAPSFLFATVAGEKLTMDVNQTDAIHYSITYFDDDTA